MDIRKLTHSEKICSSFAQIAFFKEFVIDQLCFNDISSQSELADLIVDYSDTIVVFQIKERNIKSRTTNISSEEKWLEKRTHGALKQLSKTIEFIKSGSLPPFENSAFQTFIVDKSKKIIQVVVFENDIIESYDRVVVGRNGEKINRFSLSDFQLVCSSLWSPSEIIEYLNFRTTFEGRPSFVMCQRDEYSDFLIANCEREKGIISAFVNAKYGTNKELDPEYYQVYHSFLSNLTIHSEDCSHSDVREVMSLLCQFDRTFICEFFNYLKVIYNYAKRRKFNCQHFLLDHSLSIGVLFLSSDGSNLSCDDLGRISEITRLFKSKHYSKNTLCFFCYFLDETDYRIDAILLDDSFVPSTDDIEHVNALGLWSDTKSFKYQDLF